LELLGLCVDLGLVLFLLLFVEIVGLSGRGVGWSCLEGRGCIGFGGGVPCSLI